MAIFLSNSGAQIRPKTESHSRISTRRLAFLTSAILSLTACDIVGPNYTAPTDSLPSQFVGSGSAQLIEASQKAWWTGLNDPLLNSYIERGNLNNIDILLAIERIRAAQAAAGRVGVNSLASGNLTADAARSETNNQRNDAETARLTASYQFDLFGGAARDVERAEAVIEGSQADVGAVRLTFLSQLTTNYINARFFQATASITRQNINSLRRTLDVVQERRAVGEATELEVQQALSNLASAEAQLPIELASFHTNTFAIATLLAVPADEIHDVMHRGSPLPRPQSNFQAGIPADLVRNRPDIRSAERNLAAATAAIGVSEAQLYPSVSVGGNIAGGTNNGWNFGPSLNIPVLNRGILRANLEVAESNARQAELQYRQSVLVAVEEVQSAIALTNGWKSQLISLEAAERSAATVLNLSRESYRAGAVTLTEVLDAERLLANSRSSSADALRNFTLNWAGLHIATGQGWMAAPLVATEETVAASVPVDPLDLDS